MRVNLLVKRSSQVLLFRVFGALVFFLLNLYMARVVGASGVGLFAIGVTFLGIFSILSRLGVDAVAVKLVAPLHVNNNWEAVQKMRIQFLKIVTGASFIIAILSLATLYLLSIQH